MTIELKLLTIPAVLLALALVTPAFTQEKQEKKSEKAQEKKSEKAGGGKSEKATGEKAEKATGEKAEKAKGEKVSGDIGLLDTEKNYMIVVTKDGKLVTLDFNNKTKVTELQEKPTKISDIGLGSSATVQYVEKGDKKYVSSIEYVPAKGGD